MSGKNIKKFPNHKSFFTAIEQEYEEYALSLKSFSLERFKNLLKNKEIKEEEEVSLTETNAFSVFENRIKEYEKLGQYSSAELYGVAQNHLANFIKPKSILYFSEIDKTFLNKFEKWLLSDTKTKSLNSVGTYMKYVRAIYNIAIKKRICNADDSPFSEGEYVIPHVIKESDKPLTLNEISQIINYSSPKVNRIYMRDLWLFSYLNNGMNINDIVRLKYSDIENNRLSFLRGKSINTSRKNLRYIYIYMHKLSWEIINKRGNIEKDSYIFPFISEGMDDNEVRRKVKNLNRMISENMKKIATELEINPKICAMSARHSYATISRNSGSPDERISKSMGHSSVNITQNYFGSYSNEVLKNFSDLLTSFPEDEQTK